jgi:VCBS repeat-containing protein
VKGRYGDLEWRADGAFTYRLDNGREATDDLDTGDTAVDVFEYAVDGDGGRATARLRVTVNGRDDNAPPVADNDCWDDDDWDDDGWLRGHVVASDAESPTTLAYRVEAPPRLGSVELDAAAGTFVYRPEAGGARGEDSFRVAVEDPDGASAEALVTVISPLRIMPLGDSITAGVVDASGPAEADRIGYRKALRERIAAAGYGVDFVGSLASGASRFDPLLVDAEHEGHSGWSDDQLAAATTNLLDATPADMVLLHIGSNGLEPNAGDIATILDAIDRWGAASGVPASVFVARIIDQNPKDANGFVDAYNLGIDAVALVRQLLGRDVTVVDMQRALWGADGMPDASLYGDGIHPNEAGYERMAEAWFDALTPRLRKCKDKSHR